MFDLAILILFMNICVFKIYYSLLSIQKIFKLFNDKNYNVIKNQCFLKPITLFLKCLVKDSIIYSQLTFSFNDHY